MKLSSLSLVKYALAAVLTLLFGTAYSQYPATGNKQRLGWQTTGDGLVYRGAIADTSTLDPSGLNNAWMLLDTVNGSLYAYRSKAWQLVSGGGGVSMPFDSVTFNINEGDASEQELKYSAEKGYLQYGGLDSVQIPLLPGIWYVRNDDSVTVSKGMVVRASGTLGASGRIKVKRMIADGSIPAMYVLGIAMHDIASGADGYVMTQGKIRQVNTTAYSEGAVLYADVDTLGGLTQTEPGNGYLKLPIAFVVHSASNGTLAVRIDAGSSLRDLHDVDTTGKVDGSVLRYDSTAGYWKASTTAGITAGDTSVFARDFQISGTAGQVAYFNAANAVTSDTAFRWSAANKTLGINTSTTSGANIIIKNSQEPSRSTVVATQTFAADTTNWTRGTGWTFNGTAAVATAATGNLTYTPALTITSGNAYEVTYTISGYSAGTLLARVGDVAYDLPTHNATANAVLLLPTSATGGFRFTTLTFTGNLDNVSVVEVSRPASVLLAGQNDNDGTIYSSIQMPSVATIGFGTNAGRYATGTSNNFFGVNAGRNNTTGFNNNFFGANTGQNNTTGYYNNFFGFEAGLNNTTGLNNNFFGFRAGQNNTTAANNNFFGTEAGQLTTTGGSNNFFGNRAGQSNTNGSDNNFFGSQAGQFNTFGGGNNFFGFRAGQNNTTGTNNTFIGQIAGSNNISGGDNVMIGPGAGVNNVNGSTNIFIGLSSGRSNKVGSNNVYLGSSSGRSNTNGGNNISIGQSSMYNTVAADTLTGSNNIAIGQNVADNIRAAAAGNVAIGNQVDLPTSNGSNQGVYQNVLFFTGASGTGTTIAAGSRAGIKTNAPASDFHVAGEVRIDDLKPTGAPRNIVGSSSTGDLSTMAWGNGLTVSVGDTVLRVDTSVILPKVNVSGTTNYLQKSTGAGTIGNSVVYETSGGNVGINSTTATNNKFQIGSVGSSGYAGNDLAIGNGTQAMGIEVASNRTNFATNTYFFMQPFSQNTADSSLTVDGNFRVAGGAGFGRAVRIGTQSSYLVNPTVGLMVNGNASRSDFTSWIYSNSANTQDATILRVGGSDNWNTDKEESIDLGFNRISSYYQGSNKWGLKFYTYPNATFTSGNVLTFNGDGNVGIATASPARTLHVQGEARISDLTTDTPTRIVGADADGDLGEITLGTGLSITSGTLNASGIASVYIPINLFAIGDTVTNTTTAKDFFLVHSGLNGYCIDSYTVKAIAGAGSADIQLDKNGTGGNLQAISGTTVYTKDTNIALVTGDYIRGQVFNLSGTLVGLGLTLEIKATCN